MPKKKRKVRRTRSKNTNIILIQRKFFVYSILVIILGFFLLKIPLISQTVDVLGISSFFAKGGDDNSGSSGESRDSDDDSSSSGPSGNTSTKVETRDNESDRRVIIESNPEETKTEIRISDEERIRARTKDGRTRIDITSDGIKTRFEQRDDKVIIKVETEEGEEELEDETILKIEDRLEASGIKIATAGAEKFVIQRASVSAVTNFPLSVDLATNTLTVNTPAGERQVAVLPDQAVQNILAANILSHLVRIEASEVSGIESIGDIITLGERNGVPVYEISGVSNQKLLGFIPVLIEREVSISAETGEVESLQSPLFDKVLDLISF